MTRRLRALIVEDSEDDLLLLQRELKRGDYEVDWLRVQTAPDFSHALENGGWDIILSDYSMPSFTGIHALEILKEKELDIPFVLISGTIGEELAVQAMKAGAQDYLIKGNLARLIPTIERELRDAAERREKRRAQKALQEANQNLNALIECSPIAIIAIDVKTCVLVWNPAAEAMFGWTRAEVLGKPLPIVPPRLSEEFHEQFQAELLGRPNSEIETTRLHRDGRPIEVRFSTSPLYQNAGEICGSVGFFTDVTQRKLLEAQLRQATKMEAIGQLAGGVAHDFNNLLQIMLGYSQLIIEKSPVDSPHVDDLREIVKAGEKAFALTRQLLAFSRRQVLQQRDLDLNLVIGELLRMLRRLLSEQVELEFIPAHQIGTVNADPGQMEQIVINLCVNARDAMPSGGKITIETENVLIDAKYVRTHPWAREGRYVMLTITDNGVGMGEETLAHIFEPFYTTKGEGAGTGLGLATVYGIVKQHEGFIHVYSEPGEGTTFKIYLPMVQRPASEVGRKLFGPARGGTELILVAEDDENVRGLAVRILEGAGYQVITAVDGEQAVRLFADNKDRIDLVLLDVIMPKLSGRAVFDRVKAIKPEARVLFCSGYSANGIHTEFVTQTNTQLIQKPYSPTALLSKIREILDAK